ncbi:hypothetical protein TWF696_008634 [Orbilia brochopaga]|uniref:F-box domain-containing protein n=1 Tax=Orbilia brochopaga TaxID=3140254 RepID=A0AAV9UIH9_9PEZI
MCHICQCPNEVLLEIFSYFDNDGKTSFNPKHYADGDPREQIYTIPDPDEPFARDDETPEEAVARPDRAALFDFRRVCRMFNALVTPLAFARIRLAFNLEHTERLVRNLIEAESELASHVKHITISPKAYLEKPCILENGRLTDSSGGNAHLQAHWALTFVDELSKLFTDLPPNTVEITIRSVYDTNWDHTNSIEQLNKIFYLAISQASSSVSTKQIRKTNIHADDVDTMEHLWWDADPTGNLMDSVFYRHTFFPVQRRMPPLIAGAEEINIFSPRPAFFATQTIAAHLPPGIKYLTIQSQYHCSGDSVKWYQLPCAETLHSLVLGSSDMRDVRLLQLVRALVNVSKFHIYNCDIFDGTRPSTWPVVQVDDITQLRWAHIFDAAAHLEKLVDFQAGNLSYQSVRKTYRYLDVKRLWIFTPHDQDFESFRLLKRSLFKKGGNVDNACSNQGWYLDEKLEPRGITLAVIEEDPKYRHLAQKKTQEDYEVEERRRHYWRSVNFEP